MSRLLEIALFCRRLTGLSLRNGCFQHFRAAPRFLLPEERRPTRKPLVEESLSEPNLALRIPPQAANGASSRGLRAAWAASILLLIGGGLAAIVQRDAVMAAWPPAARLFGALGLG